MLDHPGVTFGNHLMLIVGFVFLYILNVLGHLEIINGIGQLKLHRSVDQPEMHSGIRILCIRDPVSIAVHFVRVAGCTAKYTAVLAVDELHYICSRWPHQFLVIRYSISVRIRVQRIGIPNGAVLDLHAPGLVNII